MSMNCYGCEHDTINDRGHSYCEHYNETKHNMDRGSGNQYLSFRHGHCSHDTRNNNSEKSEAEYIIRQVIDSTDDRHLAERAEQALQVLLGG